jgi:hypothetical protein
VKGPPLRLSLVVALAAFATTRPAHATSPTVGECLSATESSLKLEKQHLLRAARADLLVCSAKGCPADIRAECARRMDAVNAAIPTVVFTVKTGDGRELTAVTVTMDEAVVANQLDGTALSLDPGIHNFTFEVAGQLPTREDLVLHAGEKNRAESVVIGAATPAPAAPATAGPAQLPVAPAPAPAALVTESRGHTARVTGLVIGATGAAGLAFGVVFGGMTISKWHQANSACPSHAGCSQSAIGWDHDAMTDGTVSTISFIAGGVLAAAGVTLYLAAPKADAVRVGLRVGPSTLGVEGAF